MLRNFLVCCRKKPVYLKKKNENRKLEATNFGGSLKKTNLSTKKTDISSKLTMKEELDKFRRVSNEINNAEKPPQMSKDISILMLKETNF